MRNGYTIEQLQKSDYQIIEDCEKEVTFEIHGPAWPL